MSEEYYKSEDGSFVWRIIDGKEAHYFSAGWKEAGLSVEDIRGKIRISKEDGLLQSLANARESHALCLGLDRI